MLTFLNANEPPVELNIADMVVLPELENANIQRSEADMRDLQNQIIQEGVIRDPFIVWLDASNRQLLVDGFTRRRIILGNPNIFPSGKVLAHLVRFDDMEEAIAWININQSNRRNLTPEQRWYMIGNLYNSYKNNKAGLRSFLSVQGITEDIDDTSLETRSSNLLGEFFKVDEKTVRRYGSFSVGIDKLKGKGEQSNDLIYQYLSGNLKDSKGKSIKVSASVFEKLGQGGAGRPPKVEVAEDFLKLTDKKESVKKKDKFEVLKREILTTVNTFLKNPSVELQELIQEKLTLFQQESEMKHEPAEA